MRQLGSRGPAPARAVLAALFRIEASVTIAALAVLVGAIFFDLIGREFFGKGIFVAQRVAVYALITASLLGFSLAVGWGAHMGIDVARKLVPRRWDVPMDRLADLTSAAGCLFLGYWAVRFVAESFIQQARGMSLEILLWPVQFLLVWAFLSAATRYLIFAACPGLRPISEDVPTIEATSDAGAASR